MSSPALQPPGRLRIALSISVLIAATAASPDAVASYINILDPDAESNHAFGAGELASGFTLSGTAWDPGPGTSRIGGSPAPGGATWSILPAGLRIHGDLREGSGGVMDFSHRPVAQTGDFDLLLDPPGREFEIVGQVLDSWASHSGFSNLGHVTDRGAPIGSPDKLAGVGDIRVGLFELFPLDTLAHTFRPSTTQQVASGGSAGGDMHVDRDRIWLDDPNDTNPRNSLDYDLYTVLLHEMGHALGLGHSSSPEAVMFGSYSGGRRELTNDDIQGIQAVYGPSVPEPGTLLCVWSGIIGLSLYRRRRTGCSR